MSKFEQLCGVCKTPGRRIFSVLTVEGRRQAVCQECYQRIRAESKDRERQRDNELQQQRYRQRAEAEGRPLQKRRTQEQIAEARATEMACRNLRWLLGSPYQRRYKEKLSIWRPAPPRETPRPHAHPATERRTQDAT
jgi:hypothetical protein